MPKLCKRPQPAAEVSSAPVPTVDLDATGTVTSITSDSSPAPAGHRADFVKSEPVLPLTEQDIVRNLLNRQNDDDAREGVREEPADPAMLALVRLQDLRDSGQSLQVLKDDLARITQSADLDDRVTALLYRKIRNRKLRRWLEASDSVDRLLWRAHKRKDMDVSEALVMKRLCVTEIAAIAEELLAAVEGGAPVNAEEALDKLDTAARAEQSKPCAGTTAQGREITRKLAGSLRKRLKQAKQPKI